MEHVPLDYDGGKLPNLNEQYRTEHVPLDVPLDIDRYMDEDLEFVRDGGNGLKIATDRYMRDDLEFVRDNWLDQEFKEHEFITNEGGSFNNNETVKVKKNKMISMLAAIVAAYFILK